MTMLLAPRTDALAVPAPPAPGALRSAIEALLAKGRIPGCSIAVVTADHVAWTDGFGVADVATVAPARADTIYHLFSGTKLYTATAVMQLVESGALALEDPVHRYIPEASLLPEVRLWHLLSHQSGLGDSMRAFLAVTFPGEKALDAQAALSLYRMRGRRAPGVRVEYRNVNYAILGAIVERVTGADFTTFVRNSVVRPLGADSTFELPDPATGRVATGYMERWDPMRAVLRVLHPAVATRLYGARAGALVALKPYKLATSAIGGLTGTVPGFARFLQAFLRAGAPILTPASAARMQQLVGRGAAGIESREGTGLGWKLGRVAGRHFVNHEGGGAGFTSELRLYPAAGIGVALAMNVMRMPRTMRVAHRIAELVVGATTEGHS